MAKDDPVPVRLNPGLWKYDISMETLKVMYLYGTGCSSQGCHHCTNPDCSYAEFTRRYLNHPRGD